jgi:heme-degrading monooxygenase HmoA
MPDDLGRDGIGALGDPGSTRHRARTLRPVVAGESAVRGRRSTSSCDSTTSATEPQAAICSSAATDSSVSASSRNSARLSTTKHGDQGDHVDAGTNPEGQSEAARERGRSRDAACEQAGPGIAAAARLDYRLAQTVPAAGGRSGSQRTERRCVFGRLTRFAGVADDDGSLELYLGLVRERVLPVVRAIPGFRGYLALSDSERAEVLVLTLWASEQQMRESEETTVQLRSQAADKVGATVLSVERFRLAISEFNVARA